MSDLILSPKEITKNLLKGIVCENCVFTKNEMCSFGDQMNEWPKEDTCPEWSLRPRWMDDYMETMKEHEAEEAKMWDGNFLQRLLRGKHR